MAETEAAEAETTKAIIGIYHVRFFARSADEKTKADVLHAQFVSLLSANGLQAEGVTYPVNVKRRAVEEWDGVAQ